MGHSKMKLLCAALLLFLIGKAEGAPLITSSDFSVNASTYSTVTIAAGVSLSVNLTVFSVCQGSATINTKGLTTVWVAGSGSIDANGTNQVGCIWMLVDGAFPTGQSSARAGAEVCALASTSGSPHNAGFGYPLVVTPGQHNLCVGGSTSNSTGTYYTPYKFSVTVMH